jgi:hypothetical protein
MAAKQNAGVPDPAQRPGLPGTGPTITVSTSLHAGTVEAVRAGAGERGYIEAGHAG